MCDNRIISKERIERIEYSGYVKVIEYSEIKDDDSKKAVERTYIETPCKICGTIIQDSKFERTKIYVCGYCKKKIKAKESVIDKAILLDSVNSPREIKFDKAVRKIERQVKDFKKYEKAIEIARKKCELYDSIPEAMVAIELIKLGYSIVPQAKVGSYRVDFVIPKEKLAIEVDGSIYHYYKKTTREATIQWSLGLDWTIIHVPADRLSRQIYKLQEVIDALRSLRYQ